MAHFTAKVLQERQLGLLFDALGNQRNPKCLAEQGNNLNQLGVIIVRVNLGHERAIDLNQIEREVLQVSERRIAGPEVIE